MSNNKMPLSIPRSYLKVTAAFAFFVTSSIGIAADDISKLAAVCSACHGAEGISPSDTIPNLAGQKALYMAAEIKAIRDGYRKNSLMDEVVKNLSNQQISSLASYYSKMTAPSIIAKKINYQGKNTRAVCISCHGINGITVNDQWPNLAGQKQQYLRKQLLAFRNDSRDGSYMQVIAKELTDEQIDAVAEYYSQL
ncbi:MAG: hypothetical protein DRQ47_03930, partial [Gammaproteobacteria bacterium]